MLHSETKVAQELGSMEQRYRLAEQFLSENSYEAAIQLLEELRKDYPVEPLFHWRLGYAFLDKGDPVQAIEAFQKAIELDSSCASAWGGLGQSYMAVADWDQAERAIKRRIELRPGPHFFVFLADVLCEKENLDGSVEACLEALRLNPRFDEAWYNLGVYYHLLGLQSKAHEAFDKAIALDPSYTGLVESVHECRKNRRVPRTST